MSSLQDSNCRTGQKVQSWAAEIARMAGCGERTQDPTTACVGRSPPEGRGWRPPAPGTSYLPGRVPCRDAGQTGSRSIMRPADS